MLSQVSQATINYHEECVLKVKKFAEKQCGCTVHRIGNFDILSQEEYDDTMPLHFRLTKLSADLMVIKDNKISIYVEVKTEDINDKQGNLKLNAVQLAYFIHQFNQKGIPTLYTYSKRDGLEKSWWAHDPHFIFLQGPLIDGTIDAREYVESAIETVRGKGKK